jgi:hypothetical protein
MNIVISSRSTRSDEEEHSFLDFNGLIWPNRQGFDLNYRRMCAKRRNHAIARLALRSKTTHHLACGLITVVFIVTLFLASEQDIEAFIFSYLQYLSIFVPIFQ